MKLKAPEGVELVHGADGKDYRVDKDGTVQIPDEHVPLTIWQYGYVRVTEPEPQRRSRTLAGDSTI